MTPRESRIPSFCGETYTVGTLAVMEQAIGFHVANIKTTAVRKGNRYILNGRKCLVPLANKAPYFIVIASTIPGGGLSGIEAFMVDKTAKGVTMGKRKRIWGSMPWIPTLSALRIAKWVWIAAWRVLIIPG